MFYVYILSCINNKQNKPKYYVGSTTDLINRLKDHKSKSVETTKIYYRIDLIYYEASLDKTDAIRREKQLKTGFGRGYIKRRLNNYFKSSRR